MPKSSSVYCWGSCSCGQLGLPLTATAEQTADATEEIAELPDVLLPTRLDSLSGDDIKEIASGLEHTLFLTSKGKVFVCGNGEAGQLGLVLPSDVTRITAPVEVVGLRTHTIVQVAAGEQHSMALTSYGRLFAWGANSCGQTGVGSSQDTLYPLLVKKLCESFVVQVACGSNHTLALTADGKVYGWGLNSSGQLTRSINTKEMTPVLLQLLVGLPIVQVCCGGQVSACVSRAGFLVIWGSNRDGQLGRELATGRQQQQRVTELLCPKSSGQPTVVPHLLNYSVPIVHASVGGHHMAVLDAEGKLWTFGRNESGELGHSCKGAETRGCTIPCPVPDFVGSCVTQVQCGRNHTVAVVADQFEPFRETSVARLLDSLAAPFQAAP